MRRRKTVHSVAGELCAGGLSGKRRSHVPCCRCLEGAVRSRAVEDFSRICSLCNVITSQSRTQAAVTRTGHKKPGHPAVSLCPAACKTSGGSGGILLLGESGMEMRVHLKVCEGCGCLWYRAQNHGSVYCRDCETKLKDFPSPESRRRRGPRPRKSLRRVWAVAEAVGGAQ